MRVVFPRHPVIVKSVQHAVFIERVDFEAIGRAVRPRRGLCLQIEGNFRSRLIMQLLAQLITIITREPHRQDTPFQAIVVMNIAETRCDDGPNTIGVQRIHSPFARRTASPIDIGDDHLALVKGRLVEDEIRILPQIVPKEIRHFRIGPVTPEETRRDDLIGIAIDDVNGDTDTLECRERFHLLVLHQLAHIGKGAGDRRRRRHRRAHQMGAAALALPAPKVSVAGRGRPLARLQ